MIRMLKNTKIFLPESLKEGILCSVFNLNGMRPEFNAAQHRLAAAVGTSHEDLMFVFFGDLGHLSHNTATMGGDM